MRQLPDFVVDWWGVWNSAKHITYSAQGDFKFLLAVQLVKIDLIVDVYSKGAVYKLFFITDNFLDEQPFWVFSMRELFEVWDGDDA